MPETIPQTHATREVLKAPFPYFGGKSTVADLVWERLGNVRNFIDPFFGSGAVLLRRPHPPQIETANDLNGFICNFWRAVQNDAEGVARWADYPVIETDLHARHRWLVHSRKARASLARVKADPHYFDAKIAGWWCNGACCWIGSGWCETRGAGWTQKPDVDSKVVNGFSLSQKMPHMDAAGRLIHTYPNGRPQLADAYSLGRGVNAGPVNGKRIRLAAHTAGGSSGHQPGQPGTGIHAPVNGKRPILTGWADKGVNADPPTDCQRRRAWLVDWFVRLADRLRPVRVCCGHWARVCDSDSTLTRLGTTGVFLDPPYRKRLADGTENRAAHLYANDKAQDVDALCDEVEAWCLKWGGNPEIRIALCGLEGEYPAVEAAGWEKVPWKSRGGYGNRTDRGKENAARERIWFSPACLKPRGDGQFSLFAEGGAA